ncbi:CCA tRNA nucleotidyltransferase [Rubripirellula lacrimiformis]|uniref:CCA tRNA nucleotidyltransferase n=1 Tax=Rubripirellula lacrimiformis TaxID=1930273 RepID=UPI001FE5A526|nr:CCA tRNA nucleotidyltransferase [Rubripirellula lacrimiformis]
MFSFSDDSRASEALRIIRALSDAGFVAMLAGGCVRDALLGKSPKDYDVATDATPDAVRDVFGKRRTLAFGASFGVIGVLPPREDRSADTKVEPTEVATFRSDGDYSDGRRPDSVHFGNAEDDAKRRDFTINGLFYDPAIGQVIDFVGGQADLRRGTLRTIGDPAKRFGEDKLRMLRAVRFATALAFQIDAATRDAIHVHADQISVVSGERIGAEMRRVLASPSAAEGLTRLVDCGLGDAVMPEINGLDLAALADCLTELQPPTAVTVLATVLLHTDAPEAGLRSITNRWKLSNQEVRAVSAAIANWRTIAQADQLPFSTVQPALVDRDVDAILAVARAMVRSSNQTGSPEQLGSSGIESAVRSLGLPADALDPPPLLTGDDLRALGIPAGPKYRVILQQIRNQQLDGKISNRNDAIAAATLI